MTVLCGKVNVERITLGAFLYCNGTAIDISGRAGVGSHIVLHIREYRVVGAGLILLLSRNNEILLGFICLYGECPFRDLSILENGYDIDVEQIAWRSKLPVLNRHV